MLPDYISKAVPNPRSNRAPWYKNTAPAYAGVFLWIVFYREIANGTLDRAGVGLCLIALLAAGLISYALFYRIPATLGMQTGFPLYVVGSSTFGTQGGYVMPGLLMGLLQVGWMSVNSFVATSFILNAFRSKAGPGSWPFSVIAAAWALGLAYVGVKGIQYVARFALYLNLVPLLMILVVFARNARGAAHYMPEHPSPYVGFMMLVQIVVGFFATAGAAGVDFGMNSRDERDVRWGGLVGILLAVLVAGGFPILSVAGAHVLFGVQDFHFDSAIAQTGSFAGIAFFLFAIASIAPMCFSSFIAGNSLATMIPGVPRFTSTMVGAVVAAVLAITGAAANLVNLFTIIGASFGPICGAMAADYWLAGKRWAGPRPGINFAGYGAWAVGFVVGILPFLPISNNISPYLQPAAVYSFVVGFLIYALLAKAGLQPKPINEAVTAGPQNMQAKA
ncbi:MAG TPA: cytosine permease [Bryobacteraceae bacterium]|nr:cytosine permease [Bryobacteraceae bacterium]